MLADRLYHSSELSETDLEDTAKSVIAVYDYSWQSAEVNILNFGWNFEIINCILTSFFLLAKKLTPKCTRLALGVDAEGQVATRTQIRRRNTIIWPAAFFERPRMILRWPRWHTLRYRNRTNANRRRVCHRTRRRTRSRKGAIIGGRRSKRLGRSRDGRFVGWYHETFRHRLGVGGFILGGYLYF